MAIKLSTLIQDISSHQKLGSSLRRLQRLQALYENIVSDVLVKSSEIAFIDNECLVIFAFQGSAASNLRQQLPTLLERINEVDTAIEKIKIEVRADRNSVSVAKPHKKIERTIPSTGVQSFETLASQLDDSPLKDAIRKLLNN